MSAVIASPSIRYGGDSTREAEHVAVPRDRGVDVGDVQRGVREAGDHDGTTAACGRIHASSAVRCSSPRACPRSCRRSRSAAGRRRRRSRRRCGAPPRRRACTARGCPGGVSHICSASARYGSWSIAAAGRSDAASMSVSIGPGMISTTRMPNCATSARERLADRADRRLARPVRAEERHRRERSTTTSRCRSLRRRSRA